DLSGFEFFMIMLSNSLKKLRMPDKFAKVLAGREPREVKLREAGSGRHSLWDVKVVLDADGHMYLGRGWEQFARAHDLRLGYILLFSFDGDAVLTVKVFDVSMCRRHYQRDDDASTRLFLLSSVPRLASQREQQRRQRLGGDGGRRGSDVAVHGQAERLPLPGEAAAVSERAAGVP
uniref:TF-B3 domain-containing protein n=1 Tax=Aegilops tauschii subsp. strangulata TaxID=200361 RepID=A0A453INK4_AEGTS